MLDHTTEVFSTMQLLCLEAEEREGKADYDTLWKEMKDLSNYSLYHGDVTYSKEGLKLITLARFFGIHPEYWKRNHWRMAKVSQEVFAYRGDGEVIAQKKTARRKRR